MASSSPKTDATCSVFLIDDDRFLLDMYSVKFKNGGCDIQAMLDPLKALEELRKGATPDVILLDILMPGMSGFEFLETMRTEGLAKDSKVIVLSNQGQDEDIKKAMDLGAAGYIVKASAIPSEVLAKTLEIARGPEKK
jgi:CheY-like chemotaxis protein